MPAAGSILIATTIRDPHRAEPGVVRLAALRSTPDGQRPTFGVGQSGQGHLVITTS